MNIGISMASSDDDDSSQGPGSGSGDDMDDLLKAAAAAGDDLTGMTAKEIAERATMNRLGRIFPGHRFKYVDRPDADFIDQYATGFDAMGTPEASLRWAKQETTFLRNIPGHAYKSDFAVVDVTGFTDSQIAQIQRAVGQLPIGTQARIMIIRGTQIVN